MINKQLGLKRWKNKKNNKDWLLTYILYFLLEQDYKYTRITNNPLTLDYDLLYAMMRD